MTEPEIIISISDKRAYKAITLENQLTCLIVSDKDAQKSSAALSVAVGSFSDPDQAHGLAHYLEHMLFMGTTKYPQENEYSNFLSKNAGSSNAYTGQQQTNYYFEVSHNGFNDALDRFSRFFIDPLMLDSSSERQLNAVHSEHSKNLQSDPWRKYQLSKHLSKPNHPYHKFSTGDKSTLSNPNLRQMLFDFYNKNYSANLMKLVVYGQDSIETLESSIRQKFKDVKNNKYSTFKIDEHPFGQQIFKKLVKLVPVKDKRSLELTWLLKNYEHEYKHSPSKYVSHILGHEGKGSLLSFLIGQGLATSLSAGGSDSYSCYSQFQVSVTLTEKGQRHLQDIIGYVFYFIEMVKEKGPQEWVINEIKRVNKMKFDFLQKRQGMNFCSSTAKNLHKRKIQEVFVYGYFMEDFAPNLIKDYLSELGTGNLLITVESQTFQGECTQLEPIYQSKYTVQVLADISPKVCNVSLPPHNEFIPDDLTILPLGTQIYPKKIYETNFIQAFYKEDHEFALPKAEVNIRIYFESLNSSKIQVVRSIFMKMLKEKLRQFTYMAQMAELDSQCSFGSFYTLNLKICGFRDSFDKFTNQYLEEIISFVPTDAQLFLTLKEKQKKQYANYFLNNPYQLAYNVMTSCLRQNSSTSPTENLQLVDHVILDDLVAYAKQWKKKVFIEYYMAGNISQGHALKIAKEVQQFFKNHSKNLSKDLISGSRPIKLQEKTTYSVEQTLKSKDQNNNSIIVHYQYEAFNKTTKVFQELANSIVKQPAFDFLRTKQQLGYIVMTLQDDNRGVLGLSVLVQSNIKNSYELSQYVSSKFVNDILKDVIQKLDQKTFNQYKSALQNTKKQKQKTLSSQCQRFWGQIVKHSYFFQRKQQELKLIPLITLQEFKKFLTELFYEKSKILQIHQISQGSIETISELRKKRQQSGNFKPFNNAQAFRKKMTLYPDYYSHP